MIRRIFILCFGLLVPLALLATHNRAGQITFELVSGYTYRVTVTTFTYTKSLADRQEIVIDWGDNTTSIVDRGTNKVLLPNDYYQNKYITTHTFPGPGIYEIVMQDPNRNFGINNIPNSVNVIFSIKSVLVISPDIGQNSSPFLLNYPIDKAAKGHIFIHNPAAWDPDGDSLSYKLTVCTEQDGRPIENYEFPKRSDTLYVDPVLGDFVWYAPVDTGKYNVAINIEEWRQGVKIGNITRDMQINVYETDNNPPVNPPLRNFCVEAGSLLEFQVTTTDADNDSVRQTMIGGPLAIENTPATFTRVAKGLGFSTSTFSWQTTCDHIRKQPWQITLKSEDNNRDISLFDIDNFLITVLAPAPDSLISTATSTEIELHWKASECGEVVGYYLYRREAGELFIPDSCEYGVPGYTGYTKIATLDGRDNTFFTDDNNGEGLVQGISYCYMVTAYYADGSESYASERTCNSLVPGFPSLLNTSVTNIDAVSGSIFLSWAKPRNFDMAEAPGPYVFVIYRSEIPDPTGYVVIDSVLTGDLNDTTYTDTPLNTVRYPYYYQVKMFNNTPGNRFEMRPGESEIASSLYIDIIPDDNQLTLNIRKKAPWINSQYVVYRKYNSVDYVPVDTISTNQYIDTGLKNGETFYYKVQSFGWRPVDGVEFTNANWSHENSGTPVDNTPPCPPLLTVNSLCDSLVNVLTWTNPNNSCANDVVRYIVYFSPTMDTEMDSIASTSPATDTTFRHYPIDGTNLAGCYAVSAVDSFGNESARSAYFCVDECPLYQLPNVFTPNNDNVNDIYRSLNLNNVIKQVNMKIYNRYGQLVYETTDPDINWKGDGKSGVYYYICDVYEPRISGIEVRALSGFIHVYAEGRNENFTK